MSERKDEVRDLHHIVSTAKFPREVVVDDVVVRG